MEKLTMEVPPTRVVMEQPHAQVKVPFKKGDKVTTFDDKGNPVKGIVAWIGRSKDARPDGSYIIGVYTVRLNCSVLVFTHVFIELRYTT